MIVDVIEIFVILLILTIVTVVLMDKINKKWFEKLLYFVFIIVYFIFLYIGQRSLINSIIDGTARIGTAKEVKVINSIDLQYNVRIKLKDKYKKIHNAKEATYNFSQNEIKGFKLQKNSKKVQKLDQSLKTQKLISNSKKI